ncbi:MAG: sugar kinase [Anaerolineae bacterium]|nr:sugar kinase [Anaerolineae bacterium]
MSSTATNCELITLGETMWRLSPPGQHQRLEATNSLDIQVGGAESNVAVAVARLGKQVAWWSRLPDNPLGRHVAQTIHAHGVNTANVCWAEGRLGTYFVEFGNAPRPTQVIYDRAHSAASQMQPNDFPWEQLLGAKWLHLTGITPALSQSCLQTVRCAFTEANKAGISISFDLNYRAKLWTPAQAAPILDELAGQASIVIAAQRDIKTLFGIEGELETVLHQLHSRWNGATIVITQSAKGASSFDGHNTYHVPAFHIQNPITIGAGDSFDAGLLCALLDNKPLPDALTYGNALAALKLTMPGDIALVTRHEIENLLQQNPTTLLR